MANKKGARKTGKFIAVNLTPDVCKTPMGSSVVPVPYQIVANLNDSASVSPNVDFTGFPAFIHNKSKVTRVAGDEAGTAGGVKSGTNRSIVEPIEGSTSVYVNKKPVVRNGDKCKMNNGNTIGKFVYQGPSSGGGGGNHNPPVTPETSKEAQASVEKKGLWSRMSDGVHGVLDVAGFIPGFGAFPDLANAGIYALEGNKGMAGLSVVAAVPGVGDGIKGGTIVAKGGKQLIKQAEKQAAKKTAKELAERAAKEKLEREIAEKAIKKKAEKKALKKTAKGSAEKSGKDGLAVAGKQKFYRSKSERRKALKRDAEDSNSKLTKEQREYIKENDGNKVPKDCEVAHKEPLYTAKTVEDKRKLDVAENMETMQKSEHRASHKPCGVTFHDFPR